MAGDNARETYNALFPTEADKAAAFDRIAEAFYFNNFGALSKADTELLVFTIFLERAIETNTDMNAYSDYTLSKQFAITQSRISAMKVRAALKYPQICPDWKAVFQRFAQNARRDGDKLLIFVPDKNVFLEVKNAIEVNGGYSETTLTNNLLKVDIEDYVDLMLTIRGGEDRIAIINEIKQELKKHGADAEKLEKQTTKEIIKEIGNNIIGEALSDIIPIQFLKGPIRDVANNLVSAVITKMKKTD